jgi:hypothetical protein
MRTSTRLAALVLLVSYASVGVVAETAAAGATTDNVSFTVTLTSQQSVLEQVGEGGEQTYGWNQLVGKATTDAGDVDVNLLGNVEYTDGSGPFFGFVTLKFASLATLGLRMEGKAKLKRDGSTSLNAKLRVIGGSGPYTGVTGKGTFKGGRAAQLGSPIEITFDVTVRNIG